MVQRAGHQIHRYGVGGESMVKIYKHSTIEVWSTKYINHPANRDDEDKKAVIVQAEAGSISEDYIVEVLRPDDAYIKL